MLSPEETPRPSLSSPDILISVHLAPAVSQTLQRDVVLAVPVQKVALLKIDQNVYAVEYEKAYTAVLFNSH